ncbi:unnamed protein product [Urochloa humidicola]
MGNCAAGTACSSSPPRPRDLENRNISEYPDDSTKNIQAPDRVYSSSKPIDPDVDKEKTRRVMHQKLLDQERKR